MEWIFIAGTAISIISEFMGASAKKAALEQQAKFEEGAAAIALQDAAYDVWRIQMAGHDKVGSAKVRYAASGVDTGGGTPVDTLEQMTFVNSMEANLAELRGQRVAWTHRERARLMRQGVEDVDAAIPLNIAADILGAGQRYSAIGQRATPNGSKGRDGYDGAPGPTGLAGSSSYANPWNFAGGLTLNW